MPYIIRTSDRKTFKKCRQRWDFGSKMRQNYEPIKVSIFLDFGTAVHKGMEVYYDPKTWEWLKDDRKLLVHAASIQAFVDTNRAQLKRYEALRGVDEEVTADFKEREILGRGMLENYFQWGPLHDKFAPTHTEIEFEVPIPVPPWMSLAHDYKHHFDAEYGTEFYDVNGELWFDGPTGPEPVVYQGRIDLIVQDSAGRYWIDDHKTAGRMRENLLAFLPMDEQMKSYGWAIQKMLGIPIAGVLYNELYKGVPEAPAQNQQPRQGRWFSVNKQQDTAYGIYRDTVAEMDPVAYTGGLYDEFLEYLKTDGKQYFRRTPVLFTDEEYTALGYQICLEAIDMLSDPSIYPNPDLFSCDYCDFRVPCRSKMEQSDYQFALDELYIKRDLIPAGVSSTTDTTQEPAND